MSFKALLTGKRIVTSRALARIGLGFLMFATGGCLGWNSVGPEELTVEVLAGRPGFASLNENAAVTVFVEKGVLTNIKIPDPVKRFDRDSELPRHVTVAEITVDTIALSRSAIFRDVRRVARNLGCDGLIARYDIVRGNVVKGGLLRRATIFTAIRLTADDGTHQ